MRKFVVTTVTVGTLWAAALGLADAAAAFPGDGSAADTAASLRAQGYQVQINGGTPGVQLSRCTVTGINPATLDDSASLQQRQHTLVTIDVSCPSN
jgi:hypothetical protein